MFYPDNKRSFFFQIAQMPVCLELLGYILCWADVIIEFSGKSRFCYSILL